MKKLLLLILICASCRHFPTTFERGSQILKQNGYTDIQNTGKKPQCCWDGEDIAIGFTAINKNGKIVNGCFCTAISKKIRVRFDEVENDFFDN